MTVYNMIMPTKNTVRQSVLFLVMLFLPALLCGQDRGLGNPNSVYIEKGTFAAGLSGSYHTWNAEGGMDLLGIVTGLDGKVKSLSADAHADWFFKDNLALIAMAGYSNMAVDGNSAKLSVILDLSNKHLRRENYVASVGVRKYIPLFDSKILALFGEGRLSGSRGYSKNYSVTDRGKEGTYSDLYSVDLGLVAGVSVFIADRLAIQVSLPKFFIGYEWEKQTEAQVNERRFSGLTISSEYDLLRLELGTVFLF